MLIRNYPVDRVLEQNENFEVKTLKFLSHNEPIFEVHFPEAPIYPGSMILQSIWASMDVLFQENNAHMRWILQKFQFKKPCKPGDILMINLKVKADSVKKVMFSVHSFFDDTTLCNGQFIER